MISGGTERILLVDDEEMLVTMEEIMLKRMGYTVTSFTKSREALAFFEKHPDDFDLVIMDMAMPHLSGKEMAIKIRAIRSDMPILLCSGFNEFLEDEQIKKLGISGVLMKPVVKFNLSRKIREILDNR